MKFNYLETLSVRLTKLINIFCLLSASILLAACGGGGGGGSSSEAVAGDQGNNQPSTPVPSAPITSTSELQVPSEFTFSDMDKLDISISVEREAYLSICSADINSPAEDKAIEYQECLLRTWIRTDEFAGEINLPRHVNHLLAAVLVPGESSSPKIYEWHREQGLTWVVR